MKSAQDIIGLLAATASAFLLWRGSEEIPWSIQTVKGESDTEKSFKRRRARFANAGFALLGSGFLLQLVSRLF